MDSKQKRLTILAATLVLLTVLGAVLWMNRDTEKSKPQTNETSLSAGNDAGGLYENGQVGNDLSAFLRDDSFFDTDSNAWLSEYEALPKLSLVVTSIEKDLRIQVVDEDGKPVKGESFLVNVSDAGEYKDLDKDGIIYVAELSAGNYDVSLQPIDGYRVANAKTNVRVKEQVEYVMIEDISLLILTEADIDALAEDSAAAVTDGDKTEVTSVQTSSKGIAMGIDVSKWQGEIDWKRVKAAGIDYAIIRCGYRGSVTGALVEDPFFEQNIKGAIEAGVEVGIYFFTQAVNEVEAVEEASMVISLIKDYDIAYPVFIDTEGAGGKGRADDINVEVRTAVCEAFCSTVQNAGYRAGVYASCNWYNNRLSVEKLERYVIWLAEYRKTPKYDRYYNMWQYTSKGKVDGIEGNVDLDISYGNF